MSSAPIYRDSTTKFQAAVRRGAPAAQAGARRVTTTQTAPPREAASAWIFRAGTNVDGSLTSTSIGGGSSASVPYSGFATHGSPDGCAAGTGGIDLTESGLYLVFLSIVATGGGGTGYVRLTIANQVLSQAAIGSTAVFQQWLSYPVDAGFGAEFVGEPFVENAAGASVTVTGDVYVYPAIAG